MRWSPFLGLLLALAPLGRAAQARPVAPELACRQSPDARVCEGRQPDCALCHDGTPPELNRFGASIQQALHGLTPDRTEAGFVQWFGAAWVQAIQVDADGDGFRSIDELIRGTDPASAESVPDVERCGDGACAYDPVHAFRRVHLDFCGTAPSWAELEAFRALGEVEQRARLHADLEVCLDTEYWRGIGGRVWHLADPKIRPINGFEESGFDFALFVYANTDDRDVRDLLTAEYDVMPVQEDGRTRYGRLAGDEAPIAYRIPAPHRAGMLTTPWFLIQQVMFSSLPRTAAALAYRAYLGLDIARLQGLDPVVGEPVDYDAKGVTDPDCAFCHSTLDPLSYPFTRYHGLTGNNASYDPDRIANFFAEEAPNITDMPAAGVILGERVETLQEWGRVASNSDYFAQNVVRDYWTLVLGAPPGPADQAEFEALWRDLMTENAYRVEAMLHDLVDTEAYGAR